MRYNGGRTSPRLWLIPLPESPGYFLFFPPWKVKFSSGDIPGSNCSEQLFCCPTSGEDGRGEGKDPPAIKEDFSQSVSHKKIFLHPREGNIFPGDFYQPAVKWFTRMSTPGFLWAKTQELLMRPHLVVSSKRALQKNGRQFQAPFFSALKGQFCHIGTNEFLVPEVIPRCPQRPVLGPRYPTPFAGSFSRKEMETRLPVVAVSKNPKGCILLNALVTKFGFTISTINSVA